MEISRPLHNKRPSGFTRAQGDIFKAQQCLCHARLHSRSIRNSGTPTAAEITPTGSCAGEMIVRATVSANIRHTTEQR